jgi:hypothetical protein
MLTRQLHAALRQRSPSAAERCLKAAGVLIVAALLIARRDDQFWYPQLWFYALIVAAPEAGADNAITLWVQSGDPYPQGGLAQGGRTLAADLQFELLYLP